LINTAHTNQAHQRTLPQSLIRCYLDLRHEAKVKVLNLLRLS
jgi:hypothetical protein